MRGCFSFSASRCWRSRAPFWAVLGSRFLLFDELDDGAGRGGGHRVAAEGGDRQAAHAVGHLRSGNGDRDGQPVAEPLGAGEDVRHDAVVLDAEPAVAGASPGGLHFVADEQPAVAADDFGDDAEVVLGRGDETADALDRLGDEAGDAPGGGGADQLLHVARASQVAGGVGRSELAPVAVGVVRVDDSRQRRAAQPPGAHPGQRHAERRPAMVGVAQGDDLARPGGAASRQNGHLVGFGAAVGEERLRQAAIRGERGDLGGQGRLRLGGEDCRDVAQPVHLLVDRAVDTVVGMADANGDNAAEEVQVLIPVGVPDVLVLGAYEDQRPAEVVKHGREQMVLVRKQYLVFGHDPRGVRPSSAGLS